MTQQFVYTSQIIRLEDVKTEDRCSLAFAKVICSALNIDSTLVKQIGADTNALRNFARSFSKTYVLGFAPEVAGNSIFIQTAAQLGVPVIVFSGKVEN